MGSIGKRVTWLLVAAGLRCFAALPTGIAWEVRVTGNDNNGGGFVAGATGTDYSQQDTAQFSGSNLTVDGTTNTKVTSASHAFTASDVGNLIHITTGAGWAQGFYQIVSVAANAATLDRSPAPVGTSGGTWAVGGALANPATAITAMTNASKVFIKYSATPYTVSTGITVPAGGNTINPTSIIGYESTRTDAYDIGHNNRPTLQASGNAITILADGGYTGIMVMNLKLDCAQKAAVGLSFTGSNAMAFNNKVTGCTAGGISNSLGTSVLLKNNEVTNLTATATYGIQAAGSILRNFVHDTAGAPGFAGIVETGTGRAVGGNVVWNLNTNCGTCDGIAVSAIGNLVAGNTVVNVSRDAYTSSLTVALQEFSNNVGVNWGRYGLNAGSAAVVRTPALDGNCLYSATGTATLNNDNNTGGIAGVGIYSYQWNVLPGGSPVVNTTSDFRISASSPCYGAGLNGPAAGLTAGSENFGALGGMARSGGGAWTFLQ